MIPASIMLTYSSFNASKPKPGSLSRTLLMITAPSSPAFAAIWNKGASSALRTTPAPVFSSPFKLLASSATFLEAWIYAEPPPQIIPSSTAALVAAKASSRRSFASFISVSVAAPTRITPTPPESFASLSSNFSLSNSDVVSLACIWIWLHLAAIASGSPIPSTMIVFSFSTLTDFARPSISIVASLSS